MAWCTVIFGDVAQQPLVMSGGNSGAVATVVQFGIENTPSTPFIFTFLKDDFGPSVGDYIGQRSLNDRRRHSVALVASGSTVTVYIDGIEERLSGSNIAGLASMTMNRFTIGNDGQTNATQTQQWQGTIDQALIWDRAISSGEVQMLHQYPFCYLAA